MSTIRGGGYQRTTCMERDVLQFIKFQALLTKKTHQRIVGSGSNCCLYSILMNLLDPNIISSVTLAFPQIVEECTHTSIYRLEIEDFWRFGLQLMSSVVFVTIWWSSRSIRMIFADRLLCDVFGIIRNSGILSTKSHL